MTYRNPLLVMALVGSILPGCAGIRTDAGSEKDWYVTARPGSTVEVMQTLTAPSGARLNIQNGEVVPWRKVVERRPYCQFRLLRPSGQMDESFQVDAGTFTVKRVYRQKDFVGLQPRQYAFGDGDEDFENTPSERTMATYFELASDSQPEVYQLVCARWDDPYDYNHLSLEEMRQTLGDLVRITTR